MGQKTSELWKRIHQMRGTTRQYQFDINGVIYGPEHEVSHSVSNSLFDEFGIGNASSAKLSISLYADNIPRAAVIKRYIRLKNEDAGLVSEWRPKGIFYTNRRTEDDGLWTIDAFDAMRKAERVWVPAGGEGAFPMTMPEVVEELAGVMGVEIDPRTKLNPAYTVDEYPYDDDYTIRDMLRYIAAAHGGNWTITDEGKLLLVPLFSAPAETGYLVTEDGDAITFGGIRILVDDVGITHQSQAAVGAFDKYFVGLDLTGLRKNSVQRPVSKVTLKGFETKGDTPAGYTRLEYIEATGTQFIDAGLSVDSTLEVLADMDISSGNAQGSGVFGGKSEGDSFTEAFCLWTSGPGFRDDFFEESLTLSTGATGRHTIHKKGNVTKIDSESVSHTAAAFKGGYEFLIFAVQEGPYGVAAPANPLKGKLYSFQVKDGSEQIRDFIPCKKEDGTVGLYDSISGSFFENAGTGEFIAGPETGGDAETRKVSVSYSAGDDSGMEIYAECPYATQEMVDAILDDIGSGKYEMYSADDVNVDPAMELGDGITMGGISSVIATVDDDGSGYPSLSQPGKTELEDEYPYESTEKRKRAVLEKKVENLQDKVDEVSEKMEDLILSSGVISFNGRTGEVVPEKEDYQEFIDESIRDAIYESWKAAY